MILEASGVDPDAVTGCCLVACEVERFVYFLRLHDIEISIHHYSYQANALSVPDNFMGISFQYVITLFWDECSVLVLVIFFWNSAVSDENYGCCWLVGFISVGRWSQLLQLLHWYTLINDTMWGPPSYKLVNKSPSNYSYKYHKP